MADRGKCISQYITTISYQKIVIGIVIELVGSTDQVKSVFQIGASQNCRLKPLSSLYFYQVDGENKQ